MAFPQPRAFFTAIVIGVSAGAVGALWVTVAEAQGSSVPGMAGPAQQVPGQAGPVAPAAGQAGPHAPVPGQSGPVATNPKQKAPPLAAQPAAPARFPRCDAGACPDDTADGGTVEPAPQGAR